MLSIVGEDTTMLVCKSIERRSGLSSVVGNAKLRNTLLSMRECDCAQRARLLERKRLSREANARQVDVQKRDEKLWTTTVREEKKGSRKGEMQCECKGKVG